MADISWLTAKPVAHRGYHDMNHAIWENTMSAFTRAIDAGFSIECDLQYAADGNPVIFHDDALDRLCGVAGDVREKTTGELAMMPIGGTTDKVPSLRHLLRAVKGKVPLVLELKGRKGDDDGFADSVLEALDGYGGPVALMSFDVWLLKDLKELGTTLPVGLTAWGTTEEDFATHEQAMALGLDFISYCVDHLPNRFITAERARGIPVITWTVRDDAAVRHTFAEADQMTFEGFDPRESAAAIA